MSRERLPLAVLGDPLSFTLSPALHRAGLESAGVEGTSEALRTPVESLGARLGELAARGYRGANLTIPLKEAALDHLASVSEAASRSRSVNTVTFENGRRRGDTTDGEGFVDFLRSLGRRVAEERVVLLGGGGAARSLALALSEAGSAEVAASVRDPARALDAWNEIPVSAPMEWRSPGEARALARATLVVNATPLEDGDALIGAARLLPGVLLVDLRYHEQPTAWVRELRARGFHAYDGLGMLVFQARRSLEIWTGRPIPVDPLACAVGWPR